MEALALINYYGRREYYHHDYSASSEMLSKRPSDSILLFWRAYAMVREGNVSDGMRELQALEGNDSCCSYSTITQVVALGYLRYS